MALLTREFPPEVYGGAGVHVEYLSRELARLVDCRCSASAPPASRSWSSPATSPGPRFLPHRHGSALRTMSVDLRMAADVEGVDLVHSHTWYANLGGHLAKLLYGIPHVVTTHSLEPLRPWKSEQLGAGYALSSFCERIAIDSADAVIAVSESHAPGRHATPIRPSTRRAIHVIHNGIDPDEYRPDPGTDVVEAPGDRPGPAVRDVRRPHHPAEGHRATCSRRPRCLDPAAQLVLCAGAAETPELGRRHPPPGRGTAGPARRRVLGRADAAPAGDHPAAQPRERVRLPLGLRAVRPDQPGGHGLRGPGGSQRDRRDNGDRRRRRDRLPGPLRGRRGRAPDHRATPAASPRTWPRGSTSCWRTPPGPAGTARPDAPGSSTVSAGPGSPRTPPGSTSNFRAPEPAPLTRLSIPAPRLLHRRPRWFSLPANGGPPAEG